MRKFKMIACIVLATIVNVAMQVVGSDGFDIGMFIFMFFPLVPMTYFMMTIAPFVFDYFFNLPAGDLVSPRAAQRDTQQAYGWSTRKRNDWS